MLAIDSMLFLMIGGHFLADYPLQGDFLARGKNHRAPLPGVPWYQCLVAHCMIQGLVLFFVTGNLVLALFEVAAHLAIDFGKSDGWYGFNFDQVMHILCKIVWCYLFFHWKGML